jgi:hypothetical protein
MGTYADKIFESIKKEKYSDRVFNQINQELSQKQQNNSRTVQRPNSDLHRTNATYSGLISSEVDILKNAQSKNNASAYDYRGLTESILKNQSGRSADSIVDSALKNGWYDALKLSVDDSVGHSNAKSIDQNWKKQLQESVAKNEFFNAVASKNGGKLPDEIKNNIDYYKSKSADELNFIFKQMYPTENLGSTLDLATLADLERRRKNQEYNLSNSDKAMAATLSAVPAGMISGGKGIINSAEAIHTKLSTGTPVLPQPAEKMTDEQKAEYNKKRLALESEALRNGNSGINESKNTIYQKMLSSSIDSSLSEAEILKRQADNARKYPALAGYQNVAAPNVQNNTVGRIASGLAFSTANMLPSIAANMVLPGSGTVAIGLSSGGNAYEEALLEGKTQKQALGYGILSGVSEAITEKLLGGIKAVGGGTTSKVLSKVSSNASNKIMNAVKKVSNSRFGSYLLDGLSEANEEWLQANLEPIFRNAIFDENNEIKPFSQDKLEAALLGFLSASVLNAPNLISGENTGDYDFEKLTSKLQEQIENQKSIAEYNNKAQYSIQTDSNGKKYVNVDTDQHIFEGVEPKEYHKIARKYILENFRGKIIGENESRAFVNKRSAEEYAYPANKRQESDIKSAKMKSSTELDNLMSTSQFVEHTDDDGRHPDATGGWDWYSVDFVVDGQPFNGTISVKNTDNGRVFYDMTKIRSLNDRKSDLSGKPLHVASVDKTSINPTIPQKLSGVKNSIRENTGNITENRKIRVPESELKVMKAIAKNHKIPFEIKDLGVDAKGAPIEGKYENGVIYVSPYAKKPSLVIFKHELTHYLEKDQYRYEQLLEVVRRYYDEMGETLGTDYAAEIRKIYDNYRARGEILEDGEAERELIANFAGKYLFTDEKAIQYLVKKRPNIARSIVNWIREQIAAIKGDAESELLIRAERMYLNALKAADKRAGVNGKSKYSFGGENAKTANISALNDAKSRIANGEDSETVRRETGWFKGYDGKWRFEIDDSQAEFRPDGDVRLMQDESYRRLQELTEKWADDDLTEAESEEMDWLDEQFSDRVWEEKYRLDDYLDHPKLYEAYPMLRFTSLVFDDLPLGEKGFYNPKSNTIVLSRDLFGKQKNTLLHEIQHIIQKYEGFAKGSSPKYWSEKIESGYSKIDENGIELMPSDLYRSTAGEIEARDVSNRLDYTSEQRKNTRPDIDRTDVVFADESSTSMEIVTLDNGKQYVRASESKVIKGTDTTQWSKQIADYINNEIRKWNDFKIQTVEGDILTITRDTAYKAGSRNQIKNPDGTYRPMSDAEYLTKLNAEVHINELSEISKKINKPNAPDTKKHRFAKNGFSYRTAYFQDYDGKYYKITLSVGENGNVSTVYNVGKINKDTLPNGKIKTVLSGSKANSVSDDTTVPQKAQDVNTSISNSQKNDTGKAKYSLSDSNDVPLEQRVSGDNLLDAQDLIDTVKDVGAKVDGNGYITVYHRTNNQSKEKILSSGQMTAKEDGIFFSTKKDGQNAGYGSEIIEFKIPAEKLMLDDIFDDEAHLRLPLKRAGETIDVKPYLTNDTGNSQFSLSDDYDNAVEQYGAIPPGENPARDVKVPKQMNDNTKVRRTVRTAMEASGTPGELVDRLKVDIANDVYDYKVVSDKSAVSSAKDRLDKWGLEKCYQYWKSLVNEDRKISKNDMALAEQMYIEAAHNGDFKVTQELMVDIAEEATRAGQNAQSIRLLKNLTPEGRIYKIDKLVYRIQKEIDRKTNGKAKTIKIDENLKKRMLNANSVEEMDAIEHEISKNIYKQIPEPTKLQKFVRKWNEWRYLAMLGNPRTHIRNIFGNALFAPMVNGKNAIGIALERTLSKDNRTKARLTAKDKATIEFAKSDFDTVNAEESKSSKNKYNESLNGLDVEEKVFKNKALEWARKTNSNLLEWEDTKAKRKRYSKSFAQFIKARGWDYQNLTDSQLDSARNYAMREAKRATFQDTSEVANALNKLSHQNIATEVLVEGLLPFKKTPINILKRGVEYSPFGIAKGITELAWDVKKGNMNASQAIDTLSCGLSGTAMMMVGVLLSSLGVLTSTSDDDKEGEFDKLSGNQEYALQFFGKSYTIDWIAPLSMPLFIGAEIENAVERGDADNGAGIGRVLDALTGISDPMFNLSMLQGINSSIKTVRYSDNPTIDLAANTVSGYLGQGIPTILGQTARTVDTTRRNSYYTPKDSAAGKLIDKTIKKTAAKIPGVSMLLEPYIDKWGNEQVADNWVLNAFENFASPGYYSENTNDSVTEEMARLYKATSDTGVVPHSAKSSLSTGGNTYRLSEKEYTQYQKTLGKASHEQLQKLINSTAYSNMSNEEKAVAVGKMYRYAEESAKVEFYKGRGIDFDDTPTIKKFNEVEESGVDLYEYLYAYVSVKDMESDKNASGETIRGSLKRKQISCMVNQLGIPAKTANKIYDLMH